MLWESALHQGRDILPRVADRAQTVGNSEALHDARYPFGENLPGVAGTGFGDVGTQEPGCLKVAVRERLKRLKRNTAGALRMTEMPWGTNGLSTA